MESKAVSEVKGVTLTMDLREAIAFLVDPERAQDHVRSQLKGHGLEVPEGNGPVRKHYRATSTGARVPHRATSTGEFKCDRCGQPFTSQRGVHMHMTKMHPETLED
jgi:formylmethanofuran dehydrogenase subunit E